MFEQIKLYISNKWEKLYPLLFSSMICLLLYFFKDNEIIDKCYYKCFDKTFISALVIQSPNQKIPDRKTKCVIKTHINIKQNVIFGAKLKPV